MIVLPEAVQDLLTRGGPAMVAILAADILAWSLILERLWFLRGPRPSTGDSPAGAAQVHDAGRSPRARWARARQEEEGASQRALERRRGLPALRALLTILPLLGLLGTVLGMMELFESMGLRGGSGVQGLAAGISQATLSTLAGLLSALVALPAIQALEHRAQEVPHAP